MIPTPHRSSISVSRESRLILPTGTMSRSGRQTPTRMPARRAAAERIPRPAVVPALGRATTAVLTPDTRHEPTCRGRGRSRRLDGGAVVGGGPGAQVGPLGVVQLQGTCDRVED